MLRQNGRLLLRLDELEKRLNELEFGEGGEPAGLPIGTEAPAFELPDLAGDRKSLAQYQGQPLLLIFFNPACGFCRELLPKLAALPHSEPRSHPMGEGGQRPGAACPLVLIITTGEAEANRHLFADNQFHGPMLLQEDGAVAKAYRANGTPTGYLVSGEGKIASELAMGAEALLDLAAGKPEAQSPKSEARPGFHGPPTGKNGDDRANRFSTRSLERSKIRRDGLKAGTPAPDFRLPRLDGHGDLALEDLRGRRVLLVFRARVAVPA